MRLWINLCADLAIRSTTAARLGPENYNPARRELRFRTKCGERLTLPVTEAVRVLIDQCDMSNPDPFVHQLWMQEPHNRGPQPRPSSDAATLRRHFTALRRSIGITRKLTLHDLRRTTAVAMYRYTRNIRAVQALLGHRNMQSTIWYLDHDLEPIAVDTLETIKKPFIVHRSEKQA
jgi:integrase